MVVGVRSRGEGRDERGLRDPKCISTTLDLMYDISISVSIYTSVGYDSSMLHDLCNLAVGRIQQEYNHFIKAQCNFVVETKFHCADKAYLFIEQRAD